MTKKYKIDYTTQLNELGHGEFFTCPAKDILNIRGLIAYQRKITGSKWVTKKIGNFYSIKKIQYGSDYEYTKQKLIEYQSYLFEKGLLKNKELKNDMVSEWLAYNN